MLCVYQLTDSHSLTLSFSCSPKSKEGTQGGALYARTCTHTSKYYVNASEMHLQSACRGNCYRHALVRRVVAVSLSLAKPGMQLIMKTNKFYGLSDLHSRTRRTTTTHIINKEQPSRAAVAFNRCA